MKNHNSKQSESSLSQKDIKYLKEVVEAELFQLEGLNAVEKKNAKIKQELNSLKNIKRKLDFAYL